ncbi:MAG: hypothetical protein ACTSSE_07530 [Candidatus Thorarchaeota archaeon]
MEFIISSKIEETSADVCRANWHFERVNRKSNWFHRTSKEEPDKSDEYSSIHDSVEYYN